MAPRPDPQSADPSAVDAPAADRPSQSEARSRTRRVVRGLGIALLGLVGLAAVGVGLLQFDAIGTALVRQVASRVAPPGLRIEVDRVSGSWVRSLDLTGVRVAGDDGATAARIDTLALTWSLPALLQRRIALGRVEAAGVETHLVRDSAAVRLRGAAPTSPAAPTDSASSAPWTVSIDELAVRRLEGALRAEGDSLPTLQWVDGGVRARDVAVAGADGPALALDSAFVRLDTPTLPGAEVMGGLTLRARGRLDSLGATLDTLAVTGAEGRLEGSGRVALPSPDRPPGPVDLALVADGFPLALLHGAFGRRPDATARLDGSVRLAGTTRRPDATLDLTLRSGGRLHGTAGASVGEGPVRISADLAVEGLDPSRLLADTALAGRIEGGLTAALEGSSLQRLNGEVGLRLDGVALPGVPLRSASLTSVWNDGSASVDAAAEAEIGSVRVAGTARPLDSIPSYDLAGPVSVSIPRDSLPPITASGRLSVEGRGIAPANADARARVELDRVAMGEAHLDAATLVAHFADGALDWQLDARDAAEGRVRAAGRAVPGSSATGSPTTIRVDSARVRRLDLAGLLGDSIESRVDGRLEGLVVLGAPEQAEGRFDLAVDRGRWGAIRVDTLAIEGALRGGRLAGEVTLRSSAGRADGTVTARPFAEPLSVEIDSLVFADVDAGALSAGADSLPRTRLAGRASGSWTGRAPETARASLLVTLDSSRVNGQAVTAGQGRVELAEGGVDAGFDLALADSGQVSVVARALPFAQPIEVVVERLGFTGVDPFALGLPAGATPPARVRLAGRASGVLRGLEPGTLEADLRMDLDESRVNGETVSGGHVEATARSGRVEADADLALASGRFTADARADLSIDTATWALEARLLSDAPGRLAGLDTLEGRLDATVAAEGRGTTPATLSGRFRAAADSAVIGALRLDTLRLTGALADGFAALDTLVLRSNVVDLRGGGRVALTDSARGPASDLSVQGELRSLTPLEPWVGIRPLGLGEGRFELSVAGAPDALRWTADGEASALLIGTTELLGLTIDGSGQLGSGLALRSLEGEVQLDRLTVAGVDVAVSRLAADWDGDEIVVEGDATVDDRRDVLFSIVADLREERPRADFDQFDVRVDDDRWSLVGSPSLSWGDGITFDSLALAAGDQSVLIDGHLDLSGTSDLQARVEGLRLGGLTDLLDLDRIDGTLTTDLTLEGSAADPHVRGEVDATLVRDGGAGRSRVVASLAYDTLLLDVDAAVEVEEGGRMEIVGFVPVDLALTPQAEGDTTRIATAAEGDVDLSIRADSFAVAWVEPFLDPAAVRSLSGHLEIDARVEGTQAAPTLSGRAGLRDGGLLLPALGVRYERARVEVALEGDRARIDTARVHTDDGTLTLTGGVNLPELSLGEFDITGRLDRFQAIHNDAFRVRLSGTTELVGTTLEPRLEGDLQLVETDVYLDDAVPSGASVRPVELSDEEIRELEEYLGFSVTRTERDPGALFDALALDVAVTASRDTWVRQRANPELEIQATGEVRVTKAPNDSLLFDGRMEAVPQRSWVEQFGRRFSIQQGIVELQGTAAETRIDVQAVYRVSSTSDAEPEATITLDVDGTLDDLSLTLGSEPSMENADIVSYLATGRPASSTLDFQGDGEGGGLRSIGSEFALGQVTGLVEGLAAEGVGLDVVEIRTDGLRGATLIAGRYVQPALYVGFKQPVGRDPDDPDADAGFEQTEVEVELQALRWLLLNMEASNSAVSFLFRSRHAY